MPLVLVVLALVGLGLYFSRSSFAAIAATDGAPVATAATASSLQGIAPGPNMANEDNNMQAMLALIRWAEGTSDQPDAYSTVYGYASPLTDLFSNPWDSGQVQSVTGPSGQSSACGAYQFEPESFREACAGAGISDQIFDYVTQDTAAAWIINVKRHAGDDVKAGRLSDALSKLSYEWASLPPARYNQPVRDYNDCASVFVKEGGTLSG